MHKQNKRRVKAFLALEHETRGSGSGSGSGIEAGGSGSGSEERSEGLVLNKNNKNSLDYLKKELDKIKIKPKYIKINIIK